LKTSATNRRLRVLLTAIANETLIPRPDFQRRLVWTNRDKVEFLRTVLQGYPFPEIYVAAGKVDSATGEGTELLVDGQQRLTTLYQYFKGDEHLRLPPDVPPYAELSEKEKLEFLEYEVVVRDLGNLPIETIREVFLRINSTSYGLNAMEIHNARYAGAFKQFGERVAQHQFFVDHQMFSPSEIRRMDDIRYCLGLIVTIMSTYFNRDSELENFLERYNEEFEEENVVYSEVEGTLKAIEQLGLDRRSRAFKKADFFTLFVEIHRALFKKRIQVDIERTAQALQEFYEEVERVAHGRLNDESPASQYYRAALQASNDRRNRIIRGSIIESRIVPLGSR